MKPEDLIKAAMRNRIFRVPLVQKSSMHIRFKRLDLVWHLNKLAGGNSLKNKYRQTQWINTENTWR